jgi:hypothetical protein
VAGVLRRMLFMRLLAPEGKLISPRDHAGQYGPRRLHARNEVAHMESSLVEFTLDNRSIDEVRARSHFARTFSLTLPTVPAIRGEWRGVPVLVVGVRGKILEDIFSCESPHYCHHTFLTHSLTG